MPGMMTWTGLRSIATAAVWVAVAPILGTLACRAGTGGSAIDELLTVARSELAAAASTKWLDIEVLSPAERDRLRALGSLDAPP